MKQEELEELILNKVHAVEKRNVIVGFIFQSLLVISSSIGLFFSFAYIFQNLVQSGFFDFISLLFSDIDVLSSYGPEFAFSLIESLPVVGIIAFLSCGALFIWSSTRAYKDGGRMLIRFHSH